MTLETLFVFSTLNAKPVLVLLSYRHQRMCIKLVLYMYLIKDKFCQSLDFPKCKYYSLHMPSVVKGLILDQ